MSFYFDPHEPPDPSRNTRRVIAEWEKQKLAYDANMKRLARADEIRKQLNEPSNN
jgi:hypothetical protein